MKFKERWPTELGLQTYLTASAGAVADALAVKLQTQYGGYLRAKHNRFYGTTLLVVGMFLLASIWIFLDLLSVSLIFILLLVGVCLCWIGYRKNQGTKEVIDSFNVLVNKEIFTALFELLQLDGTVKTYVEETVDTQTLGVMDAVLYRSVVQRVSRQTSALGEVLALLDHSQLVTENRNQVQLDDMIEIQLAGKKLFLAELNLKHVTGSGKDRRVKKIFHGYFVSFPIGKVLQGKTFVSTEGDTRGFGHTSFWSGFTAGEVKKTSLEWNEFEDLLHVATSNPTEARYILTPNFMIDLHDWWKEKKQNIRFSFLENRVYILFPDTKIQLGKTLETLGEHEVGEYLQSIAVPLLHVLHVIEDVEHHLR